MVLVDEDQQSLAIGKKGQNVRLASRLCGWDIDIKTRAEFEAENMGVAPPVDGEELDAEGGEHGEDLALDAESAASPDEAAGAAAKDDAAAHEDSNESESPGEPGDPADVAAIEESAPKTTAEAGPSKTEG